MVDELKAVQLAEYTDKISADNLVPLWNVCYSVILIGLSNKL
jgi:hypothetical protein